MATPGSLRPGPYGPTDWCLRGVDPDHDPDMGVFPELGDPVCGVHVKKHYSILGCTVELCMKNHINVHLSLQYLYSLPLKRPEAC